MFRLGEILLVGPLLSWRLPALLLLAFLLTHAVVGRRGRVVTSDRAAAYSSHERDVVVILDGRTATLVEHPGVLRSASLGRVDDEAALGERHASEAARQDVGGRAVVDGERAEIDVPRLEAVLHQSGAGRQGNDRLGDPPPRIRFDRRCRAEQQQPVQRIHPAVQRNQ